MKIVCDNCATKYSIADEKVRGKVFKIRCKKCSHIIVVRGNEGAAAAGAPDAGGDGFPGEEPPTTVASGAAAAAAGSDSVWHLVVDREQIGPLTAVEVRQKFAAGEIDVETYGWREGFADWLRLGSIDDFRDLGGAQPEPEGATRRTDSADLFSNSNSQDDSGGDAGSDLFGSAAAQAASAPAPAASDAFGGGGGGGLFGAPEQAAPAPRATRNSSPGFAPSAQPAMAMGGGEAVSDGSRPMTGQRNENSVLFSLNNLQALASGGGGGGAPQPKPGVDNRPGFANSQTEGSGLIDIRAMAASTLAASPTSSSKGGDEPEMAAAPIFSPMAAPILMPAAPSGPPKWIWAVLGVGVLAVLGIVVVGILLLTRKPEPTVVAGGPNPPGTMAGNPGAVVGAANPGTTAAPTPTEKPAVPDKTTEAKAAAPEKTDTKAHEPKVAKTHEPKAAGSPKAAKESKTDGLVPPPSESAPAPAPKKSGKGDALDDLLNGASPDKPAKAAKVSHEESSGGGDDSSLPDQLEKGQIVGGMSKVKGKVGACYDQFKVPGMAMVHVTIQKSGSVSGASVGGSFAGTPTGGCVEKAVKGASFPKFKGAPMSLDYPFMLR